MVKNKQNTNASKKTPGQIIANANAKMINVNLITPDWLKRFMSSYTIQYPITKSVLSDVGIKSLQAKQAYIEDTNMAVAARLAKRIPETLDFDEVAALLYWMFDFKNVLQSKTADIAQLSIYIQDNSDLWEKSTPLKEPMGVYTSHLPLMHTLVTYVSPKTPMRSQDDVLHRVSIFSETVFVSDDKTLIPVNNGIFNQKTKELEPFTPDHVYLTKIGSSYNPNAINPILTNPDNTKWDVDTWINELAASSDINTLFWQVISAAMQPNRSIGKSVWFYSELGNNGKGTIGQLIKNLVGDNNYSSLSVTDFKHEFLVSSLLGKAVNISDENDVDVFIDSVKDFKATITGDDININRKHKDPIKLQFKGLNIQMMNGLPKTKDKSDSLYRRILLVPFIKSFTNNGEKKYIKDEYIHRQDVLEYVLAKAVNIEFDEFINPIESQMLLQQYKEKNNPTLDFWIQFKDEFEWGLVPNQFLYALYKKWFAQTNPSGSVIAQRTFYSQLASCVNADGEWENHIESDKSNVHTGNKMDADEPLITEYGLDQPDKNGTPSPWVNPKANGTNPQKKRDFVRKTKYRGILRV